MITMLNKWNRLTQEQKERFKEIPYGWVVRNLLKFGNCLVPKDALKKVGKLKFILALEEEFSMLGYTDAQIEFNEVLDTDTGKPDLIAYVTYASEKDTL